MLAEKKSEYYREEASCTWAFDETRTVSGAATITTETLTYTRVIQFDFSSSPVDFDYGIRAAVQGISTPDGTGDETNLYIDSVPLGLVAHKIVLDGSTFVTGGTFTIEIRAKKRYSRSNQTHRIIVDDIRVDVDGVNKYASGSLTADSGVFTPTGVPFTGGCPKFYGGVTSDIVPATGADAPIIGDVSEAFTTLVRGEAHGINCLWRRKTGSGDAWVYFPIAIRDDGIAYGVGDCDTEEIASPTGTDTSGTDLVNGLESSSEAARIDTGVECPCPEGTTGTPSVHDKYRSFLEYKTWGNLIRFIKNCDKRITRMVPDDHAERVKRGGTPEVQSGSLWEYAKDDDIGFDHTTVTRTTVVHAEQSAETDTITGTAGALEAMLSWDSYCHSGYSAISYTAEKVYFVETSPAACTPILVDPDGADYNPCFEETVDSKCFISKSFAFPTYVQPRTGSGGNLDIWPELDHENDEARKINTIDAPLWNFLDYFPDDNESDEQTEWQVDSGPVSTYYWVSLGHQWDGARMTLISAPLGMGAHGSYIADEYLGRNVLSNWVGAEIVRKDATLPAASKTLTSANSGQITADNCVLTHGASITVNPDPGETECTVTIDAAVWGTNPRMFAQLMDRLRFAYEGDGISDGAVYLVGVDLSEYELYNEPYTVPVDETLPIGKGTAEKYAGSWAQELNAAIIATDEGSDALPAGISSATMGDPERLSGFQLLPGRGVKEIKFVFQVTDDTEDITLEYPTFYSSEGDAYCVAENRGQFAIVWEDGPKIRPIGNVAYYDSGAIQSPPVEFDLGLVVFGNWTASLIDFLCARRTFYEGIAPDSGLTTELASLFDSQEGTSVSHADSGTMAWLIEIEGRTAPMGFWLNSCGCPPVPCDVTPGYAADWDKDAALAQEVVTYAVRPRRLLADREIHLFDGSAQWTALERSIGDDWRQTVHSHAVGNNEHGTATVRLGGIVLAEDVSPWHGFSAVVGGANLDETARGITHACTGAPDWRHAFAWMDSADNVVCGRSPNTWPYQIDHETKGFTADWVHLSFANDRSNTLYLTYESGGSIYRRTSTDEGRTWSVATTIFTGPGYSKGDQFTSQEPSHERYFYAVVPASNLIKGKILDAAGNTLEAEFTAIASGVADDQIRAWERTIEDGRRRIALGYINTSGSYVIAESDDGKTFS